MPYLHSHNIVHGNLKPSNIFFDEFLFPKINGCHLFKEISKNPIPDISQMRFMSDAKLKLNVYSPPEKHIYRSCSTAGDVYSYSMILYQLITNEEPFPDVKLEIIQQICEQKIRPKFKKNIANCYKNLIEKCWSDDVKERPTFDEIIFHLKNNPSFINDKVNKEEFQNYVDFIDASQNASNLRQFEDFVQSKNKTFRKVHIDVNKIRNQYRLNFSVNVGSIDLNKFEKLEKIGSGGFGVVYKVIEKETDNLYAAKISIYEMDLCENETILNLSREIDIISKLNHLSLLKFIGFSPYNFKGKSKPVIITEYVSNGSLDRIIELERMGCRNYEWDDTKKLINIYGIAAGMSFMHKQNILHRDLKPANILLDDFLFPKIADFGLSKVVYEEDDVEIKRKNPKTSGFKGTYAYCAPEIMDKQIYTKAGDVYAYGMIVYEILCGVALYENFNKFQLLIKVSNGYRPKFIYSIPYCYRKLIEKCWDQNYEKRPSFEKIVEILETNKDFITKNVNENEYLNYVSMIKEKEKTTLLSNDNNHQAQNQTNKQHKKVLFDLKHVDSNENDNGNEFLDLTKYEKQEIINKGDIFKLYKFKEIETGHIYSGQMSMQKIKNLNKEDLRIFKKN